MIACRRAIRTLILSAVCVFSLCFANIAYADLVSAKFSGDFQNAKVVLGSGITYEGGCFTVSGDYQDCIGFEGISVEQPVDTSFVAGYLLFFAYEQSTVDYSFAGNLYTLNLVITTDAEDARYQGPDVEAMSLFVQDGLNWDELHLDNGQVLKVPRNGTLSKFKMNYKFGSLDFLGVGDVVSGPGIVVQSTVPEPSAKWLLLTGCMIAVLCKRLRPKANGPG